MTVWLKQGVCGDPSREMLRARNEIHELYQREYSDDLHVTAIRDGNHLAGSFHYRGDAEDYQYPMGVKAKHERNVLRDRVKVRLGPNYDVVAHDSHLHVEFDPK